MRVSSMNRRQFGALGAAGFAAMAFGGRDSADAADAELVAAYGSIGPSRHPWQQFAGQVDYTVAYLFFDSLLNYDEQGCIIPSLAESYEVRSLERVRLRIRDGVTFHNGQKMTVEDVKYSLEESLNPDTTFIASYFKRWLDHVEIIDSRTIETVAKVPYRSVPELLAYISFVYPAGTPIKDYKVPVGTGPYTFVEFIPNNRVVAVRNDNYWRPKARFSKVTLRQIPESATRMAALVAGEIDFAESISIDDVPVVEKAGREIVSVGSNSQMYVTFNRTAPGPMQDVRVRQAVNYAIDKDSIRKVFYGGMAGEAQGPYADHVPYFNAKLTRYAYDPKKAKAMLAEAGFANGFETTLATSNNRYLKDSEVAQVIAGQLQEVGIRTKLYTADFVTYQQAVRDDRDNKTGKFGLYLQGWATQWADPDVAFGCFETGGRWNFGGFDSPRVMELLKRGRQTLDQEELAKIYGEIQDILWDSEAQCVGICFVPYIAGVSKKLSGWKLRPTEIQQWGV